jgi:hypothetical protein
MSKEIIPVYDNGVSVSYNKLLKSLEFQIPSGMVIAELIKWQRQNKRFILKALTELKIKNAAALLNNMPKNVQYTILKEGSNNG